MALFSRKLFLVCSVLGLVSAPGITLASEEDTDDGVTIETVDGDDQYRSPEISPEKVHLAEHFDDVNAFKKKWVKSEAKKQGVDENIAKYDGKWEIQNPVRKIFKDDLGLVLTTEAKHAAISALLDRPFEFTGKPFVVQYEVTMQEGQNCGGAYIKLLSKGTDNKADLRKFYDQTPYTIMFGPDKCGNDNKLHFIFRHRNPKNGTIEEKHSQKPIQGLADLYKDKEPHLYTLVVRPDNTFTIFVDGKEANSGSLLEDFTPPVNPPEEIADPDDHKPNDWDEREKIVDPTATKPEDWDEDEPAEIPDPSAVKPDGWLDDEPEMIPDPAAVKPTDWDEEMDGDWEAPLIDNPECSIAPGCGTWRTPKIPNPKYKGVWRAPLISNPNYRGKWAPRRIPNPDYFYDDKPYKMTPIHAVGFELWSMSPMLLFDNLIITDDEDVAEEWARQTFELKRVKISKDSMSWWGRVLVATGHRPGWWALYATYVAVPIVAYVLCLLHRVRQDSVLQRGMKYARHNPWVYAAVIIGTFIIIGGVVYLCCWPSSDSDADMKKTDAVQEDDPHQSEAEAEADVEAEAEAEPEEEPSREDERPSKEQLSQPELEDELVPDTETARVVDTEGAGDGQRKRKPRKE